MSERSGIGGNYAPSRDTQRLGLSLGHRLGQLDSTSAYVTDDRFDHGAHDALHRRLTVADSYSAIVDLEENLRGRIDLIIEAFGAEEQYVAANAELDPLAEPAPGVKSWRPYFAGQALVERISMNIADHKRFAAAYADHIEIAYAGADISKIVAEGKIAMVLMLVSGFIADSLDVLADFHRQGIRVICPSHLSATGWADSSVELNDPPGLSAFGRDVVRSCKELGVLIDLAHCSDHSCRDILEVATQPTIVTHTKMRSLSESRRDMPDELVRRVAEGGGVVSILASAPRTSREKHQARRQRDDALHARYRDPFERACAKRADAETWATKLDLATIDHAVAIAGIDHVGLASHAQSVPQWKEYTAALIEHGYGEADAAKIMGANVVRVLQSVD